MHDESRLALQEAAQQNVTGLEAEIQTERKAQRDLKLVLAAAEQQAQRNSNERGEIAVRYQTSLMSFKYSW